MDKEFTEDVDGEDVIITVQQLEEALWLATARFRGIAYAAKAGTPLDAEAALLIVLKSERSSD